MQVARRPLRSPNRSLWAAGFTLLVALAPVATLAAQEAGSSGAGTEAREAGVSALAPDTPLTQYRAYRRMHAQSERFGHEGWLDAWTEMDEQGFRYTIVSESGSDYIRTKVLRALLKREQELVAAGESQRSEISVANYEFREAPESNGERQVLIKPKRKDTLLVDGRMVLSRDGSELLRVEGRLVKNPSFWTSLVNVIRHYARLDGVRVPISTESVAKVKFAGMSHLEVRYEYETINGRPVSREARRPASPPPLASRDLPNAR